MTARSGPLKRLTIFSVLKSVRFVFFLANSGILVLLEVFFRTFATFVKLALNSDSVMIVINSLMLISSVEIVVKQKKSYLYCIIFRARLFIGYV